MVLAAGPGTRLRPLTDWVAKSLVPVGDRPALAHVFERLAAADVVRVVVNTHHRADDVRAFALTCGPTIAVSEENDILGTAGGVARAATLLGGGDVLVWNADVITDVDLRSLVSLHGSNGAVATLVIQPATRGRGPVGVDERGRVVRLRGEQFGDEVRGGEFLGISLVGAELRARLPAHGCLVGDAFLPALRSGATLGSIAHDGRWYDIGTIGSYLAANLAWLDARGLKHWAGEGTQVPREVRLDRTILGRDARVSGSGPIDRCAVWPGASVAAPLSDAVVTPHGWVRAHP
jgi:mannose-1-phosphate guanylyltransferase